MAEQERQSSLNRALDGNKKSTSESEFDSSMLELSALNRRYALAIGEFGKFQDLKTKMSQKAGIDRLNDELKSEKTSKQRREQIRNEIALKQKEIEKRAVDATVAYSENAYKRASAKEKILIARASAEKLKQAKEEKQREIDLQLATDDLTVQQTEELLAKRRELEENYEKQMSQGMYEALAKTNSKSKKSFEQQIDDLLEEAEKKANEADLAVQLAAEKGDTEGKEYQNAKAAADDAKKKLKLYQALQTLQKAGQTLQKAGKTLNAFGAMGKGGMKEAEDFLVSSKSLVESRLQGSEKEYDKIVELIENNTAISPYMKTQDILQNMKTLAESGIAYNIEERAFLATISDKIAATFDAFDSNLTRLIKLQQADTTAARLGMEASLTKFLNNMFQDTSYLTGLSDSVAGAIIDANASLSRNASAEFEYIVQKWLGALSSLGMSEGTITSIAEGLNYIATGDVENLSSNTSLQTLFAMSAAQAQGLNYADLLTEGLDASKANKLLESMVLYLKDIAENADNQVVRSAYGDVFGMSISDMKAISNLSTTDISNIASSYLSYSAMNQELNNQFANLASRVSMSEKLDNIYKNAVYGVGSDLLGNPVTYSMYKMLEFMEGNSLNINIPFINAFGTGVDLNTSVNGLLNLGLGLSSAVGLAAQILGGLGTLKTPSLGMWNSQEYTTRGSGFAFSNASGLSTSGSSFVGSGNMDDMQTSVLSSASDDAEETGEIVNKNQKDAYNIDDLYKAVIEGSEPYLRSQDASILKVLNSDTDYLSVRVSGLLDWEQKYLEPIKNNTGSLFNAFDNNTQSFRVKVISEEDSQLLISINDALIGKIADTIASKPLTLAEGQTLNINIETLKAMLNEVFNSSKQLSDKLLKSVIDDAVVIQPKENSLPVFVEDFGAYATQKLSDFI